MKYNIMKNRNLILSVLLWAVCSSVFAVTLPTSSYSAYETTNVSESFSFGMGSSFNNTYLTSASDYARGACTVDKQASDAIFQCEQCCITAVLIPCASQPGATEESCGPAYKECINDCMGASLPLGTPLMLLPFIAVYAVLRRRKQA